MTKHVMILWLMTFMYAQATAQSKLMQLALPKVFFAVNFKKNCKAPENKMHVHVNVNYLANSP